MDQQEIEGIRQLKKKFQEHPEIFFQDVLGIHKKFIWRVPQQILDAVVKYKKVAIKSGHGIGKSWSFGRLPLWWLCSHGDQAKAVTTAPTFPQVERIIWSELAAAYHKAIRSIGGKLNKTDLTLSPDWYALGISTDEEQRFQGFHSPHLLLLFDEAGGIKQAIWNAGQGLVTGENDRWVVIGNPIQASGPFYDCFKPDSGWHNITVSCLETPNYIIGREDTIGLEECQKLVPGYISYKKLGLIKIPGLTDYHTVEGWRKEWGEDSPLWYAKCLGEFPIESSNTLIALKWVEDARQREIDVDKLLGINREHQMYFGVDVARFGICETVITAFDGFNMKFQKIYNKRGVTEVAGLIIDILREGNNQEAPIAIDDTGVGGGVSDILKEQGYNVIPVVLRAVSDEPEKYYDLRTEIFCDLANKFEKGSISMKDPDGNKHLYDKLAAQLTSLQYEMDKKARKKVIPKERQIQEMIKQRGQGDSPDRADSLSLAVYAAKEKRRGRSRIKSNQFKFAGASGY